MPKRTFDTMQEEDARIASSQAVLAAKLADIASLEAGLAAGIASLQAELEADIAEQNRFLSLLKYGEGITQAVPAIQAWMRGILTRRRVHCALLSADPDALAMAMWM
jgi:hypothetical protein